MPISAGLWAQPSASALVYPPSFPFKRSFWVQNAIWYSALELEVVTAYSSSAAAADVRINGQSVGKVPPRPWSPSAQLSPVSLQFGNGMLQVLGSYGRTGTNELEVVPVSPADWLIVGNWRLHYFQHLP